MRVSRWADIEAARAHYLRETDQRAGSARAPYITDVPGQSLTYEHKYQDAVRYLDGQPGRRPWIEAEAEATGMTEQEAAEWIVGRREALETVGVVIERERRRTKERIKAATTARAMHEALEAFRSAMSSI